ncbi:hypothetical protein CRENBAI_024568 [Crenichthys baileyi]|uniref:Secreted protein n=1 Tax=Crenichthys baileyi TaxID=28760 RepID=A0AAV9QVK5_9TELE
MTMIMLCCIFCLAWKFLIHLALENLQCVLNVSTTFLRPLMLGLITVSKHPAFGRMRSTFFVILAQP